MVYPGRFQPMLKHHAEVYNSLVKQYPDAEVYIGTSDKVEPGKSPFNFAEKQKIAQAHGIDPSRVLQVKNPYHMDSYPFDKDNTEVIFAVGEKDAEQRFPVNQKKKDGTPGYYQRMGSDQEPLPMSKRGYITVAPNVTDDGEVASASAFRQAMQGARSPEEAKQTYTKQFGSYDPDVFNLIYNKVAGKTMEQLDLNHMRKMAGLSEAPADRLKSNYYGMSDQQRQLADIGRALMNAQFKADSDEESNKLSLIGSELTRFGAEEGAKSLEDLMRKAKITSRDELLKYMSMGKDMVARGEHEMGAQGAGSDDAVDDDDEFDTDADAMAAVDDMDIDNEVDENTSGSVAVVSGNPKDSKLDLSDIRDHYGVSEDDNIEIEPPTAMGGATSSAGDTSYAGDEVSVSEEENMKEAAAPKFNFAVYDKDGKLKGATSSEKDAKSHAFRIKGKVKKLDKPTKQTDIDKMMAMGESRVEEEEMAYEAAMMDLIQLAGISTADTNIAEIKGKVVPKKGENVGFGMVDKTGLDPIVAEEAMDDTFIAKKVRDMGASLEDQKDFIKHLAHVAKELELGKYVMDNPDFVPDVMMAFKNLDEAEGCPCCGDGPCKCALDCKGCDCAPVEEVAPVIGALARGAAKVGAGAVRGIARAAKAGVRAAGTKMAINQVGDMMSSDDVDEGAEDLLALFDLGDQETDEAIGDGFLSGNKALGAAMQDIEDEIKESDINALESTINDLKKLAGI